MTLKLVMHLPAILAGHKAGWDCTFSAPKSVSVAWGLAEPELQKQIADAHDAAVRAGLDYLEKNAFSSRDRDGGQPLQGIIAATFQHSTSREQDPQLHTHCAIANLGLRADGTVCAVDFDSRWKMAAGAVYRAELAQARAAVGLRHRARCKIVQAFRNSGRALPAVFKTPTAD